MKRKREWKTVRIIISGGKPDIKDKPEGVRLEITNLDQEWAKIKARVYPANKIIKDYEYC